MNCMVDMVEAKCSEQRLEKMGVLLCAENVLQKKEKGTV